MRQSKRDGTLRRRVNSGESPGRRQPKLYCDVCEAGRRVEVDHRLPRSRDGVEQNGVPRDNAIISKGLFIVHVRIPVDELAVRRRIADLGVHEVVEAGDLLLEQLRLAHVKRRGRGFHVFRKCNVDDLKHAAGLLSFALEEGFRPRRLRKLRSATRQKGR